MKIINNTGGIHIVRKYVINSAGEESIWTDTWYGRHVIGNDCKWFNESDNQPEPLPESGNKVIQQLIKMIETRMSLVDSLDDATPSDRARYDVYVDMLAALKETQTVSEITMPEIRVINHPTGNTSITTPLGEDNIVKDEKIKRLTENLTELLEVAHKQAACQICINELKNLNKSEPLGEDAIGFAEWVVSDNNPAPNKYNSDDDNNGKWCDAFSEGINRHYYKTEELYKLYRKQSKQEK